MGFQQGISGLNASAKALDVSGNNIANASTVGFKASRANFGDVYAASMLAGGNNQVGVGVATMAIQQQFTQGSKTTTTNALDMAINGSGFYRLGGLTDSTGTLSGAQTYTRNGQFHLNKDGYIVNDSGLALLGVQGSSAGVVPALTGSNLTAINVTRGVGEPKATASSSMLANLSADAKAPVAPSDFDITAPSTYKNANFSRGVDVYDTQGNAHTLTYYFVKVDTAVSATASPNEWQVYTTVTDVNEATQKTLQITDPRTNQLIDSPLTPTSVSPATSVSTTIGGPIQLNFGTNGLLQSLTVGTSPIASGSTTFEVDRTTSNPMLKDPTDSTLHSVSEVMTQSFVGGAPGTIGNKVNSLEIAHDLLSLTQFKADYAVDKMTQDGYPKGKLAGLNVDTDGYVQAQFDNGKTVSVGRIALFGFENPNGLVNLGDNQWIETLASGPSVGNFAGDGNTGTIQSFATEDSNVDLTQELVNLIVQQRNYQANAQTIKTQDQVLQTLVSLR